MKRLISFEVIEENCIHKQTPIAYPDWCKKLNLDERDMSGADDCNSKNCPIWNKLTTNANKGE